MAIFVLAPMLLAIIHLATADQRHFHSYAEYIEQGVAPMQTYRSTNATSPLFNIDIWDEDGIDMDTPHLFLTAGDGGEPGPFIFSSRDLSLVYAENQWNAADNARPQKFGDRLLLTYWTGAQGSQGIGFAPGSCRMLNASYHIVHDIIPVGLTSGTDQHECAITEDGTVLLTVYHPTPYDLSSIGGSHGDVLLDSHFQEVDLRTGKLLFHWRASDHIHVNETMSAWAKTSKDTGWDAYHINSVQKDKHGDYYVSLRRLNALVKISGKDGRRIWQLGGKRNDFTDLSDGHAIDFAWQHDIRFIDSEYTQLTMFDNHNLHAEKEVRCIGDVCSRGSRLELDYKHMTARLLQNFYSPTGLLSYAMGSYDTTPNGNILIGWGSQAEVTEYRPDGVPVMNFQFGALGSRQRSYKVYKGYWKGLPPWSPSLASEVMGTATRLFVSWNGATEVTNWLVAASNDVDGIAHLLSAKVVTEASRDGFEVEILYENRESHVRVVALDANDAVLGATNILDIGSGTFVEVAEPLAHLRFDRESKTFYDGWAP